MKYFLETTKCNLCGRSETSRLFTFRSFRVVRCNNCSLVYVNPRLSKKSLSQIYNGEYFDTSSQKFYKNYFEERDWRTEEFQKVIQKINTLKSPPGKFLDIGCAAGYLLDAAKDAGWKPYGVEISKQASDFAKNKLKLNVFCGELKDAGFADNFFDVVTMVDTIEHMTDPKSELREVSRILKKGGLLLVDTPNISSLGFKIFQKGWRFMVPEVHLWYFSPKTLRSMLEEQGFRTLKIEYPYFETRYFNLFELKNLFIQLASRFLSPKKATASAPMKGNLMNVFAAKI